MSSEIIVAGIAFLGTLFGTGGGIIISSKLTTYRIEQLEKKVEKHNNLIERVVAVEQSTRSAHHRLDHMEKEVEAL
jgi:hypothetical protein